MRTRIAANQFEHGMRYRLKQRSGQAGRQRNPQPIAIARCIFSGNQTALAGDAQLEQTA